MVTRGNQGRFPVGGTFLGWNVTEDLAREAF